MPRKKAAGQQAGKADAAESPKTRAPKPAAKARTTSLSVDYPLEGEIVASAAYTVRITAGTPQSVEVSLDGEGWLPCRESVGHWWYDLSGYRAGVHTLDARMKNAAGKTVKAKPRQFTVIV
jgi:hypothetical protein